MANSFVLKAPGVEVDYRLGATPGIPALAYKAGAFVRSYAAAQILTNDTGLGELVSVPLILSVDTGGERFGFFLPQVNVPHGQTAHFNTIGVYETFSGPDSFPRRPSTWRCIEMTGTAQNVPVPLKVEA